jgi:hypothetical protein
MASAEKDESSRNLLDQIEGDWDSPRPPRAAATPEVQAALDAAAARLVDSLDPPPVSVPTMDELDSGWGQEDDEDDDEEEDEDDEPELPDERLDPVAYALAKKAREESIEARRVRRRAKDAAKKARRKARLDAQRSKQKGKQKKARPAPQPARPSKEERNRARKAATAQARARGADDDDASADESTDGDDELQPSSLPSRAKQKLPPSRPMSGTKPMLSKTNQWMLAVAVVIFLAAAIFAAVIAR